MSSNPLAIEFKNEHLSVSRLKLFEQCALAFYFKYVSKGETEPRGVAATFGVVLHAALEAVYTWILREEYAGLFPTERLTASYREAWQASELAGGGVALYAEGLQILRSYAKLEGTVDHMRILDSEQEFNIDVGGFKINGYIDIVEKLGDDGVRIVDFKSNRALFTKSELDTDLQMSIYGLAARTLYPWAKRIEFAFKMLRHDTEQTAVRTRQQIDDAGEYVIALGRRTEEVRPLAGWEPTLNGNCSYCDHRRRCPLYARVLAGKHEVTKVASLTDIADVAREREEQHKLAKIHYARKAELDKLLKARLDREGEFDASGFHYRYVSGGNTITYQPADVLREFGKAGLKPADVAKRVLRVDNESVQALLADVMPTLERQPALLLQATVEAMGHVEPNSPKIDSRELKSAKKLSEKDVAKEAAAVAKDEAKAAALPRARKPKEKEAAP